MRRVTRLLGALFLLLSGAARAGGLQVAPILLEFGATDSTQVLHVSNSSSAPLRAQVRVLAWVQSGGEERLEPTRDLVASPPLMEVAAGQEHMVRIVRMQAAVPARELAYRMLVDELPGGEPAGRDGVQFLLRHSVPVFVLPEGAKRSQRRTRSDASVLQVEARPAGDAVRFVVRNASGQRVRLGQVAFEGTDGQAVALVPGLLGYVLAGQQMQWTLPLPPHRLAAGGTFKARLNDDAELQALPAAAPSR